MHATRPSTVADVGRLPSRPLVTGLVAGVVWGAVLRLWMRYLTDNPSFTWTGTGFILLVTGLAGLSIGAAHMYASRDRWRAVRLSGLGLLVFVVGGPGIVLIPSIALGGIAFARRSWPTPLRAVVATLAFAPALLLGSELADLGAFRVGLAIVWYVAMVVLAAWATAVVFAPATPALPDGVWDDGSRAGR